MIFTMTAESISTTLHKYAKALSVVLGYRDLITRFHSERVLALSEATGLHCGLLTEELDILRIGALLHDIGKIGTPDHILLKLSELDRTEWETMKEHSEIGEKILLATELEGSRQAGLVVRHHHEHYNGQGYPDGRSGEAIPVQSRIVAIADSYDAMAVTRAYSRARKHTEIMETLRDEAGGKHDPQLLRVFCEVIEHSAFKAPTV